MIATSSKARIIHYGPWQIPVRAVNVLCPDGKRRCARIIGQPDTYFSQPASVNYRGHTVAGFLSSPGHASGDLVFHPYTYRKNGHLFPSVTYRTNDLDETVICPDPSN